MEYHQLGRSSLHVSRIGFGCMSLKGDEQAGIPIIHQALDAGINYFDTADLYEQGANEVLLGKALAGRRSQALIATKAGNQWRADGSGWDWNPSKKYILHAAEQSLKRLNTDHIDLYQLHGGIITDPIDETIEAFETLVQHGKIRYYGISSIRPNVIREWIKRSRMVSVMMQYSLLDRRPEEECLNLLHDHSISVLSRGGLAQGLLAGKPPKPYLNYSQEEVAKAADAVRNAAPAKDDEAATAIRFVLHHPAVASAVIGIRTREQLSEALRIDQVKNLSENDYQNLRQSIAENKYAEHR